jgi:hypothetical protein
LCCVVIIVVDSPKCQAPSRVTIQIGHCERRLYTHAHGGIFEDQRAVQLRATAACIRAKRTLRRSCSRKTRRGGSRRISLNQGTKKRREAYLCRYKLGLRNLSSDPPLGK